MADAAEKFMAFLAGDGIYFPDAYREVGNDYLTVYEDKFGNFTVKTSHGVGLSLDEAKEFLKFYDKSARPFIPEPDNDILIDGLYKLKRISEDGDVTIGCHHFKTDTIKKWRERFDL